MTTTLDDRRDLIPVRAGEREIGAYAVGPEKTVFVPAVDVTTLVLASMVTAAVTATAVAIGIAARRQPAVGRVTMGPGGWLSVKRSSPPALRAVTTTDRPWWARVLRAHRLVVQH
ncbi:hypothetical protein [Actinoplanes sp. NPDC026623]|uniref:hypothetical protein n=1 Tax=Actinoplanes sp. NPDC026623 TaxID=3155610 RepID=UPI0033FCA786